MKSVRLVLRHDADTIHPMHRFVAEHDALERYRMVHWNHAPDDHNVFLFHVVGDREAYRAALERVGTIETAAVTDGRDDAFYVYVRDRSGEVGERLIDAFTRGSLVPVPPLEYRADRTTRFTVVGESADLRAALEAVPDSIGTAVERVGEYDGADPAAAGLTARQREVVRVARNLGYFAVPREATVAEVAAELDCAPGTAAEHLRKAEARVMGALQV